jgi:hypothetical protein
MQARFALSSVWLGLLAISCDLGLKPAVLPCSSVLKPTIVQLEAELRGPWIAEPGAGVTAELFSGSLVLFSSEAGLERINFATQGKVTYDNYLRPGDLCFDLATQPPPPGNEPRFIALCRQSSKPSEVFLFSFQRGQAGQYSTQVRPIPLGAAPRALGGFVYAAPAEALLSKSEQAGWIGFAGDLLGAQPLPLSAPLGVAESTLYTFDGEQRVYSAPLGLSGPASVRWRLPERSRLLGAKVSARGKLAMLTERAGDVADSTSREATLWLFAPGETEPILSIQAGSIPRRLGGARFVFAREETSLVWLDDIGGQEPRVLLVKFDLASKGYQLAKVEVPIPVDGAPQLSSTAQVDDEADELVFFSRAGVKSVKIQRVKYEELLAQGRAQCWP